MMRLMLDKVLHFRSQIALWAIALSSIIINAYLITAHLKDTTSLFNADLIDYELERTASTEEIIKEPSETNIIVKTIDKGNTLDKILLSSGIEKNESSKILNEIEKIFPLKQLKAGHKVLIKSYNNVAIDTELKPEHIIIQLGDKRIDVAHNTSTKNYKVKVAALPLKWQVKYVSGTINGSLYGAAKKAGADSSSIMEFINLFSYDVDFQRDVQAGDEFRILYEYQTNGTHSKVKNPRILYASISLNDKPKEIYRHELPSGKADYFDTKGQSIKKALLKTPINGARISSGFGMRHHPVLGFSRMHKGLDYSAPKGTPILAAGDGVVTLVKNQSRGYGKHVQIKHNGNYSTLYAHMNKFANNLKPGSRVSQGQVIGYVGATGLASGPHLHYEVIDSGKKVNPSKVSFPKVPPLKGIELAKFKENIAKVHNMVAELDNSKQNKYAQASIQSVYPIY
jgi:murein DD-endopeptidase MepM/ murein hydrolase activator NlpD